MGECLTEWVNECLIGWVSDWVSKCLIGKFLCAWVSYWGGVWWADWTCDGVCEYLAGWVNACLGECLIGQCLAERVNEWPHWVNVWLGKCFIWYQTAWLSDWLTGWVWLTLWTNWCGERSSTTSQDGASYLHFGTLGIDCDLFALQNVDCMHANWQIRCIWIAGHVVVWEIVCIQWFWGPWNNRQDVVDDSAGCGERHEM